MADTVSTTGRIQITLEIDWPHTFGEKATAIDIYTTAARECEAILRGALNKEGVRYRVIGDVEAKMVILPVSKGPRP